jgi:1,4-alpha-glucan branching enzyme
MTQAPRSTTFGELIGAWLPRQRWFAAKGGDDPVLESSGGLRLRRPAGEPAGKPAGEPAGELAGTDADAGVCVHFVTAAVGDVRATYQVPLTYRRHRVPELEHALLGRLDGGDGERWVYDGPHDRAFVQAWLSLVATGDQALSDQGPAGGRAVGVVQPRQPRQPGQLRQPGLNGDLGPGLDADRPSRVLSGEQSNTSVIVGGDDDGVPVIVKVFRVLQDGANPDVAVTSTLTSAGCSNVPRLIGWIEGEWITPDGLRAHGHLASVSEFLPGRDDAWRLACVAVEQGRPFTEQARGIGVATAIVHEALARALPTSPAGQATLGDLADHLRQRLEWALAAVPALEPFAGAALATVEAVRDLASSPRLQRIHGDLHLGQVLDAGPRGWVLLDFEGEPLRPLADRNRLDLALRDIAGMLRSFDYAARHTVIGLPETDPRVGQADAWAAESTAAFLDAYAQTCGCDPREDGVLLRALELDKALYEVVYETRNRPTWVGIPVSAVARLLAPVA